MNHRVMELQKYDEISAVLHSVDSAGLRRSKVPAYVKITGELSTEPWAVCEYWANDPENGVYPDSFLVDYVRVYRRK